MSSIDEFRGLVAQNRKVGVVKGDSLQVRAIKRKALDTSCATDPPLMNASRFSALVFQGWAISGF